MNLLYWKIFLGQSEEPKLQHRCLIIIVLVSVSLSRNFLSNVFFFAPLFHGGLTSLYRLGGSASWPFTGTSLKFGFGYLFHYYFANDNKVGCESCVGCEIWPFRGHSSFNAVGWFGREYWMWRWWLLLQEGTSYFHLLRLTSFLSDCLRGFEFGPWSP